MIFGQLGTPPSLDTVSCAAMPHPPSFAYSVTAAHIMMSHSETPSNRHQTQICQWPSWGPGVACSSLAQCQQAAILFYMSSNFGYLTAQQTWYIYYALSYRTARCSSQSFHCMDSKGLWTISSYPLTQKVLQSPYWTVGHWTTPHTSERSSISVLCLCSDNVIRFLSSTAQ